MGGVYGEPQDIGDPPVDPTPALDDDAYVGTYDNEYLGDVEVTVIDGALTVVMGPARVEFPLTHFDGDVFTLVDAPELPEFVSTATFEVDATGQATSLTRPRSTTWASAPSPAPDRRRGTGSPRARAGGTGRRGSDRTRMCQMARL